MYELYLRVKTVFFKLYTQNQFSGNLAHIGAFGHETVEKIIEDDEDFCMIMFQLFKPVFYFILTWKSNSKGVGDRFFSATRCATIAVSLSILTATFQVNLG